MNIVQKIKMVMASQSVSEAELARRLKLKPAGFNQRMKRGVFSEKDLEQIAKVLKVKYFCGFEFPDGTKI
jgi:hypothetical protein